MSAPKAVSTPRPGGDRTTPGNVSEVSMLTDHADGVSSFARQKFVTEVERIFVRAA
jgi:hypothetical protein